MKICIFLQILIVKIKKNAKVAANFLNLIIIINLKITIQKYQLIISHLKIKKVRLFASNPNKKLAIFLQLGESSITLLQA